MMSRFLLVVLLLACFAFTPELSPFCAAQQSKATPSAPIPAQILTAKKVFIANAGGDECLFDSPQYTGGPNRAYNEFYAAMKLWKRYELVGAPEEADLVFEIGLTTVQPLPSEPLGNNNPAYDTQIRLTIRSAKNQQVLWGLTEHAQTAILQGNRDKNFEKAMTAILAEVQRIAGSPPAVP